MDRAGADRDGQPLPTAHQRRASFNRRPGASGPGSSGSCTKQFTGYNSDFLALLQTDGDFIASFHRWYTLCHISGAAPGKYFVQVRSALPLQATPSIANLTKSEDPTPENQSLAGQNRYSLRVVTHNTSNYAPGVKVYAETHLPIYSNVLNNANQTPQFYLARLLPGGGASGRILQLRFYDIGDVGGGTTTIHRHASVRDDRHKTNMHMDR